MLRTPLLEDLNRLDNDDHAFRKITVIQIDSSSFDDGGSDGSSIRA